MINEVGGQETSSCNPNTLIWNKIQQMPRLVCLPLIKIILKDRNRYRKMKVRDSYLFGWNIGSLLTLLASFIRYCLMLQFPDSLQQPAAPLYKIKCNWWSIAMIHAIICIPLRDQTWLTIYLFNRLKLLYSFISLCVCRIPWQDVASLSY